MCNKYNIYCLHYYLHLLFNRILLLIPTYFLCWIEIKNDYFNEVGLNSFSTFVLVSFMTYFTSSICSIAEFKSILGFCSPIDTWYVMDNILLTVTNTIKNSKLHSLL